MLFDQVHQHLPYNYEKEESLPINFIFFIYLIKSVRRLIVNLSSFVSLSRFRISFAIVLYTVSRLASISAKFVTKSICANFSLSL